MCSKCYWALQLHQPCPQLTGPGVRPDRTPQTGRFTCLTLVTVQHRQVRLTDTHHSPQTHTVSVEWRCAAIASIATHISHRHTPPGINSHAVIIYVHCKTLISTFLPTSKKYKQQHLEVCICASVTWLTSIDHIPLLYYQNVSLSTSASVWSRVQSGDGLQVRGGSMERVLTTQVAIMQQVTCTAA